MSPQAQRLCVLTAGILILVLWTTFRFFAGLSSAAGLLPGSGLILNWLIRHNHRSEPGIHFSGMGLGGERCGFDFGEVN